MFMVCSRVMCTGQTTIMYVISADRAAPVNYAAQESKRAATVRDRPSSLVRYDLKGNLLDLVLFRSFIRVALGDDVINPASGDFQLTPRRAILVNSSVTVE